MLDYNKLFESLEKWKNVCKALGDNQEVEFLNKTLEELNNNKTNKNKKVTKKKTVRESKQIITKNKAAKKTKIKSRKKANDYKNEIKELIDAYYGKNYELINESNLLIVNLKEDILESWTKTKIEEKKNATKLELNLIYNLIAKPSEIKYTDKNKETLISIIDNWIKNN